ncbi:titin-like [Arapaima gigas]
MASANLFRTRKTLIVPYGLKSWLGCVCRAVLLEEPGNVIDFIFDYCTGLLNFRSRELKNILNSQIFLVTAEYSRTCMVSTSFR